MSKPLSKSPGFDYPTTHRTQEKLIETAITRVYTRTKLDRGPV